MKALIFIFNNPLTNFFIFVVSIMQVVNIVVIVIKELQISFQLINVKFMLRKKKKIFSIK